MSFPEFTPAQVSSAHRARLFQELANILRRDFHAPAGEKPKYQLQCPELPLQHSIVSLETVMDMSCELEDMASIERQSGGSLHGIEK